MSLKMYFGHRETLDWMTAVADVARRHPATTGGAVELFVVPGFVSLVPSAGILAGTGVRLGAQDAAHAGAGAFTGEVSAGQLAEVGCSLVELGHAERRALFHEDDERVSEKVVQSMRAGLEPLICVGEPTRGDAAHAAEYVTAQLARALVAADAEKLAGPVIVAYEPVWAIGQAEPAPVAHVGPVLHSLAAALDTPSRNGSRVIYGGSAGPGLLGRLGASADGVFLGRFAHDPRRLEEVLSEAVAVWASA